MRSYIHKIPTLHSSRLQNNSDPNWHSLPDHLFPEVNSSQAKWSCPWPFCWWEFVHDTLQKKCTNYKCGKKPGKIRKRSHYITFLQQLTCSFFCWTFSGLQLRRWEPCSSTAPQINLVMCHISRLTTFLLHSSPSSFKFLKKERLKKKHQMHNKLRSDGCDHFDQIYLGKFSMSGW